MNNLFKWNSDEFRKELQCCAHNAGEVNFLRSIVKPGMQVVEIGANIGVTATAIAEAIEEAGHMYAFEPVRNNYTSLLGNLSRNRVDNVSAYNLAVSNQSGRIAFYKREGGASGVAPAMGGEKIWVEAISISEFIIEEQISRIDFLNLDCEGSELLVLQGAQSILEKQAPQILCEIHHEFLRELGQSADEVVRYLSDLGYYLRLLKIEQIEANVSVDACSHIYASRLIA
ncbi:MAG: FkbM family methyltransferase [Candidatus Omnitrophica bacterium]|nr:FkbM family methyltransferase [Candidatus Omnitrophota bacterium]